MDTQHELVLPNEDLPFKLFVFEGREGNYYRERHWHRSIEIFAVLEGNIGFGMKEQEYPLEAGEFMLINSNEVHSVSSPSPNMTIVIQIPLKAFEKYYVDDHFIQFTHSARIHDATIMKLIKDLYQDYSEKKPGYDLKVQSSYYELMYLLVTKYRKAEASGEEIARNKRLNRLSVITDYLRENYMDELLLEQVAKMFGYTPTYLSHMFRKYVGIGYKEYLQSIRLEKASKDILEGELYIGEIAEKHGFANSKAFSKVFQKKYGVMPGEFRKKEHMK
ncbi:AraC family transcriptional regulator [Lachnospiraceae bacterium OttesenSCG-928-E19]|nr:AraC family transcriptional regulator [Lachnospiraceae bacterium OttesenSCG-928-E19]